jgi:hypothetical protein
MVMPNFLLIGSQSAGTTSVYNYLKQHPEVYVSPIKETNFFVHDGQNPDCVPHLSPGVTSLAAYRALFQGAFDRKAVGEASPLYLVDPRAAERIRHHIPKAKLIAILRDPAERAHTAYWMRVRGRAGESIVRACGRPGTAGRPRRFPGFRGQALRGVGPLRHAPPSLSWRVRPRAARDLPVR